MEVLLPEYWTFLAHLLPTFASVINLRVYYDHMSYVSPKRDLAQRDAEESERLLAEAAQEEDRVNAENEKFKQEAQERAEADKAAAQERADREKAAIDNATQGTTGSGVLDQILGR